MVDWETIAKTVAAIAAAVVALWGVLVKVWSWVKDTKFYRSITGKARREQISEILSQLRGVSDQMKDLHREITPNHGGSLNDAVRRIERKLDTQQALVLAMEDSHNRLVFHAAIDGQWLWVSSATARLLGKSPEQLRGWGWVNSVCPEQRAELRKEILQAQSEKREVQTRLELIKSDGERTVTDWRMIPVAATRGQEASNWFGQIREYRPTGRRPATLVQGDEA